MLPVVAGAVVLAVLVAVVVCVFSEAAGSVCLLQPAKAKHAIQAVVRSNFFIKIDILFRK